MHHAMLSAALIAALAPMGAAHARSEAQPRCPAVTPAQVAAQFDRFNAAWATKDPAKVTALFTKDAVLLATVSNTPRTNPAAIHDYFVSFLKGSPVGTINTSTIKIDCTTAARLGTWTVTLTNAETGATSDVKARYSFLYRYVDGDWKIDHLHSSMMPETAR